MKTLIKNTNVPTVILLGFSLFCGTIKANDFIPSNQAFKPTLKGNFITIDIADGYYLYQNKISLHTSSGPMQFNFLNNPIVKKFPNQGTYKVYLDQAKLKVNASTKQPITLHYQGCSSQGLCYPPQKITFKAM